MQNITERPPHRVGRAKGKTNNITRSLKENILEVFDRIGGVQNFAAWAEANETEYYTKIFVKLLPTDIKVEATVEHTVRDNALEWIDGIVERINEAVD